MIPAEQRQGHLAREPFPDEDTEAIAASEVPFPLSYTAPGGEARSIL